MSQSRHMPAGDNGNTLGKRTSLHRSCMPPHNILIFVVTDRELDHMLQWRSPEAHYQQNELVVSYSALNMDVAVSGNETYYCSVS